MEGADRFMFWMLVLLFVLMAVAVLLSLVIG